MAIPYPCRRKRRLSLTGLAMLALLASALAAAPADPLPSWNDGPAKRAALDFVATATDPAHPNFVPTERRLCTFDNDGTLWVEQPIYTQVEFARERVEALVPEHPEWRTREPYRTLLTGDRAAMARFSNADFERVIAEVHSGMTVATFETVVRDWLAKARHPRFKRPYTELIYQPMLELMRHLRAHGFKTYIVTGGATDFVRAFAAATYDVPPEQVVGSAGLTRYGYGPGGEPRLVKLPDIFLVDNGPGKVEGINLVIGRRPCAAFGNSDGDRQMLEWAGAGPARPLMMLVHHDDARREYAYGADSAVGTFSVSLMEEARRRGWVVISMKNDWKRIFSFEA
jgi:phosphoglycolate phosphatase-like HAD superfamily hydrolase